MLVTLGVCLSLCCPAFAQTITGSITGTVTDATGAVVPGAKVTATNVDTGVSVSDVSNGAGIYSIRFLQIGKYKVQTEAAGFSTQSYGPFSLEIDQVAKVDVKLTVGNASVSVDISSTPVPLLDTEDSTVATTITANTIENVPLSGQNWSTLTLFTPGSIATNPSSFQGAGNNNSIERNQNGGGNSQANVNGNRAEGNNYLLDGIEINETLNNLVGYNPNPAALEEIQVISGNAPAEYGNVNGGDVIAVTKSGTNQFHGSASVYLEDSLLDANTWSNKHQASGIPIPRNPYTQTQYSATFGGPVIIPKLYNGKDKLFFFVDYFGTRYHKGGSGETSVLDALMRQGNFSELLNPSIMCAGLSTCPASALTQLYDPYSSPTPYAPYAGNLGVPINNPVVAYLIAHPEYYPLPNTAPTVDTAAENNYIAPEHSETHNNQFDIKFDYKPTSKDSVSVRYLQGTAGDSQTQPLAISFSGVNSYPDKGIAIDYTRVITNAIVNNFRAGFTRIRFEQGEPVDTTGAFGLNGNSVVGIDAAQAFPGFASQSLSNFPSSVGNAAGGTDFQDNTFQYADDLTWQKGHHTYRFGTDLLRYQQNQFYPGNDGANGTFYFTGVFTSDPNASTASAGASGYAPADWVLDRAASSGIGSATGESGQRQWRSAFFAQDDWKLLPNLTLNLGLRYEYFEPMIEAHNKQANVNYATQQVEYAGTVPANAPAGSIVCPTPSCVKANYNNWMPRLGFSYQPVAKLVVRGGFGVTKGMEGTGANLRLTYNAPFVDSVEATGINPSAATTGVYLQETQGFTEPAGLDNPGGFYRTEPANIKPMETNEWSLTTEYQVNNFTSVKLSYVGESSTHLIQAVEGNQLAAPCYIGGVLQSNPDSAACAAADPAPFVNLVGETGFLFETASEGSAAYNGLQAQYRQRTTKGLEFTVNYSYAHSFTNSAGFFGIAGINTQGPYAQNAYDNAAEWGPAGSDIRHSLNGTAVYAIPFGRGKEYGGNIGRATNALLGGWKASMTAVAYSGAPVTISANDVADTDNQCCSSRPNQVLNTKISGHSLANWFGGSNSTAIRAKYADPAPGTYGDARNGDERGPGFQQYDFSFFKDFALYEQQKLGFRMDMFNAFNVTSLGQPNNNYDSAQLGQITSVRSVPRQIQFSARYQF